MSLPFLPHFPDWKLAFLPLVSLLFFFLAVVTCGCVSVTFSASCTRPFEKQNKKGSTYFFFVLFSLAILFEFKSISTRKLFPGLLLRPTQPVHPSPPESCNGAAALNCSRRVRLFAPIQSTLS